MTISRQPTELTANRPIVEADGTSSQEMRVWAAEQTNYALILGNGTPEGVVEAAKGREYADLDGTTGTIKYFKQLDDIAGDKTTGWILV